MSVFKKYGNKRITTDDPNWEKGTWYVWRRVGGAVLHRSLKGIASEEEALEAERLMTRELAVHVENKAAIKAVERMTPKSLETGGYVYLFEAGGYFKVGRTNDIAKRLAAINKTIIPFQTRAIMTLYVADPVGLERKIHREFAKHRTKGEWFIFDARTLDKVKRMMIQLSSENVYYI